MFAAAAFLFTCGTGFQPVSVAQVSNLCMKNQPRKYLNCAPNPDTI